MAHRDLALHPERARALEDEIHREGAHLARLVQVDVERRAVLLGEPEDRIAMTLRVAVDRAWVEPADDRRAGRHRLVEQFERPGAAQQPGLRKGDDLDLDDVAILLARPHHALDAPEAVIGVDIDMRADMGRAHPRGLHRLPGRLAGGIDIEPVLGETLVVDLVEEGRSDLVAVPGQAPQRLVEMRVRFDEPRDDDLAPAILDRDAGRGRDTRRDPRDAPVLDQDVGGLARHRADVADEKVVAHVPAARRPARSSAMRRCGESAA